MRPLLPFFEYAVELQKNHATNEAIATYQQLLTEYPTHLASRYNLACLLAEQQKWSQAIQELNCIIAAEPDCTPAYYNMAICYQGLNEDGPAINYLEQTLALNPQHFLAMQTLGSLLLKKQQIDEAKTYLLAALQQAPADTDILFNLSLALLEENDTISALYYFTKVRELKPYLIEAAYNCGVIYQQAGNYPAALRAYAQVLQYNPQHFASLYNSGLIQQLTQQYAIALDFYKSALHIEPENTSLIFLISALEKNKTAAMPAEHVKNLFDSYAGHYDQHMQEQLRYTVPQQIFHLFKQNITAEKQALCLVDLGCGTGLNGEYFKDFCHTLVGVDISPKMLGLAANKHTYTTLTQQDNIEYLSKIQKDVDVIIAADVLGYYGDLQTLFTACQLALRKNGYWLFSIETHGHHDNYLLAPHARFLHNPDYIKTLAAKNHFSIMATQKAILRHEQQQPVVGELYLLQCTI